METQRDADMDDVFRVHEYDARNVEELLSRAGRAEAPDQADQPFLQATITSPPYGRLVDYGVAGQIGRGQSEEAYLEDCRQLLRTLHKWTKPQGVLWLIVDSYHEKQRKSSEEVSRLRPLPFVLSGIAESEGWILREVIVWHKDRTRPWSHHGKLRNAFEYVLLLVKSREFPFHIDRLRDSQDLARWWVRYPERYHTNGKAPDNLWHIPIPLQGSWARKDYQHACPLPVDLVRRLIELTTDKGDVICDPFSGIGTVPAVAEATARRFIATELNPKFIQHYSTHVRDEVKALMATAETKAPDAPTPETIRRLRALKYPKTLFSAYRRANPELPLPRLAIVDMSDVMATSFSVNWMMVMDAEHASVCELVQNAMKALTRRPPLSKFGIDGDIRVADPIEATRMLGDRSWHLYEHGRTWQATSAIKARSALTAPVSHRRGHFLPIVASHELRIDLDIIGDIASDDPNR